MVARTAGSALPRLRSYPRAQAPLILAGDCFRKFWTVQLLCSSLRSVLKLRKRGDGPLSCCRLHRAPKSLHIYLSCVVVRAGQHVPAEEAAAPSKTPPSTLGRVLGAVGNLVFYGGLVGCTSFWVSRYTYSPEDTQQMAAAAEEAEQRSPNPLTQAYAAIVCNYRDARMWCDQKLTEMTGGSRVLSCVQSVMRKRVLRASSTRKYVHAASLTSTVICKK